MNLWFVFINFDFKISVIHNNPKLFNINFIILKFKVS